VSGFSNLPSEALAPGGPSLSRAAERTLSEIERILRLPAGDPELVRLFMGKQNPLPAELARALDELERDLDRQAREGWL